MLCGRELVAFVGAADPARARAFYEQTLGLPLIEQTSFACVFAAGPTMLRVTAVERVSPAPYTVLGWSVDDVAAAVGELAERGVEMLAYAGLDQDAQGIWTAPGGARIAWFHDPEGNVLSVSEAPARRQSSAQ